MGNYFSDTGDEGNVKVKLMEIRWKRWPYCSRNWVPSWMKKRKILLLLCNVFYFGLICIDSNTSLYGPSRGIYRERIILGVDNVLNVRRIQDLKCIDSYNNLMLIYNYDWIIDFTIWMRHCCQGFLKKINNSMID